MILIVGGLIALGLVAAIAVVFLSLGEQRGRTPSPEATAPTGTGTESGAAQSTPPAVPAAAETAVAPADSDLPPAEAATLADAPAAQGVPLVPHIPSTPAPVTGQLNQVARQEYVAPATLPASGEEQLAAGLASQYQALNRELREVYQKSNEIERRLSLLNEIATRFEQMQNGHVQQEQGSAESEMHTETNLRPPSARELDPYR